MKAGGGGVANGSPEISPGDEPVRRVVIGASRAHVRHTAGKLHTAPRASAGRERERRFPTAAGARSARRGTQPAERNGAAPRRYANTTSRPPSVRPFTVPGDPRCAGLPVLPHVNAGGFLPLNEG